MQSSRQPRSCSLTLRCTEKMVPTDTLASMLDEPSRGSKSTQYFPVGKRSGMGMKFSTSSEAIPHRCPVWSSALKITSWAYSSSFFTSSPCTFTSPV